MSGYQLRPGRNLGNDIRDVLGQSLYAATALQIDERKSSGEEIVTQVNNVRSCKKDDTVAISVTVREVNYSNLLTVEVNG